MSALVEFPLEGGGTVLVRVDEAEPQGGAVTRGLAPREVVTQAAETFESALARLQPAAAAIVAKLRDVADPPDEVEVQFGITLSAELGVIVSKAGGEANFSITLRWRRTPNGG